MAKKFSPLALTIVEPIACHAFIHPGSFQIPGGSVLDHFRPLQGTDIPNRIDLIVLRQHTDKRIPVTSGELLK